ncbi:MAG: hypothetical protein ABIS50_10985 [Luteolibacter sp.]|uniref:hypothetical protein n=1 Tax=Luteolibacter sp. TaxID=1962973 RepID=UPI003264C37C
MKKPSTLLLLGSGVLILALWYLLGRPYSDPQREKPPSENSKPLSLRSSPDGEASPFRTRSKIRDTTDTFSQYLNRIAPVTDIDDPSDTYFQGYLLVRQAQNKREEFGKEKADRSLLEIYGKAYSHFLGVQISKPEWKKEMVRTRLNQTKDELKEIYLASRTQ